MQRNLCLMFKIIFKFSYLIIVLWILIALEGVLPYSAHHWTSRSSLSFQIADLSSLFITDFQDFMNLCKNCTGKPYSFVVLDTTFTSDDPSRFRKNLTEII